MKSQDNVILVFMMAMRDRFTSLVDRAKAFGFDYLLILAYVLVLFGIGIGMVAALGPEISSYSKIPAILDAFAFVTLILPVTLYFSLQESSRYRATWGKRKVGIQVVDGNGERITTTRAIVRTLLKFLPWQVAHTSIFHIPGWPLRPMPPSPLVSAGLIFVWVIVGIYIGSLLFSKNGRTAYDWISGTYVRRIGKR